MTIGDGVVGSFGATLLLCIRFWLCSRALEARLRPRCTHAANSSTAHAGTCADPLLHAQKRRENRSPRVVGLPSGWIPRGSLPDPAGLQAHRHDCREWEEQRSLPISQFHNFPPETVLESTLGHCCVQNTECRRVHQSARSTRPDCPPGKVIIIDNVNTGADVNAGCSAEGIVAPSHRQEGTPKTRLPRIPHSPSWHRIDPSNQCRAKKQGAGDWRRARHAGFGAEQGNENATTSSAWGASPTAQLVLASREPARSEKKRMMCLFRRSLQRVQLKRTSRRRCDKRLANKRREKGPHPWKRELWMWTCLSRWRRFHALPLLLASQHACPKKQPVE